MMTCLNNKLEKMIGNKKIVIYGLGNTGNAFYNQYKNDIPITACTSSENEMKSIDDLVRIPYDDLNCQEHFLIICSIKYDEIRRRLIMDGWKPNKDFIRYDIWEALQVAIKEDKEVIVGVGQCEIQEICIALTRSKAVKEKYSILYFDERKVCINGDRFKFEDAIECRDILSIANYILIPSALNPQKMSDYNKLMGECVGEKIVISLFEFDSYFPQDDCKTREINKYYITQNNRKLCAYIESDRRINKLVEDGYSEKQIMEKIRKNDFFEREVVLRRHQRTVSRARLMDKLATIKIADYIENEYSHRKLYCDRGHFTGTLLLEYINRIMAYLGIENKKEVEEIIVEDLFVAVNELPIYPSTASILNLEWVNNSTVYRMVKYSGIQMVTFEEYMSSLIEYTYAVKNVLEYC